MSKIFLLCILLASTKATYCQNQLGIAFSASLFDKKEMKDSGYSQVLVTKKYYDFEDSTIVTSSCYKLIINDDLHPVYEKKISFFDDSTIVVYDYNGEGEITSYETTHFIMGKKENRGMRYRYANRILIEYQFFFNQKSGGTTKINYDKKGRKIGTYSPVNDSSYIVTTNSYNENDSLVKMVTIEAYGSAIDSVISTYKYDNNNHLIERKERYASDTYFKTFQIDCSVGYNEYYKCEYDSIGRIISETSEPDYDKYAYLGRAYQKYVYSENGYVKKYFDSKNREVARDVFVSYSQNDYRGNILTELLNTQVKTTTFLSKRSKLPKTISYPGNNLEESVTYLFEYKK